jgi:hypothetical protein
MNAANRVRTKSKPLVLTRESVTTQYTVRLTVTYGPYQTVKEVN